MAPDASAPTRGSVGLEVALPAALAALMLMPCVTGEFVYDDHRFYEANTRLGDVSILWRAFADPVVQTADGTHAGLWRPLRTLLFAAERATFGAAAWGPHLVSVALHAAGTALVALLLRAWGATGWACTLGALAYGLHPVQAECVAWVSSQGDLAAAALVWGALLAAHRGRTVASLVCGAGALLAKEQAVVWPLLVPLSGLLAGRRPGEAARAALAPAIVTGVFLLVRSALLEQPLQEGGLGQGTAGPRELASMVAHQVWTVFVPARLLFDWQLPGAGSPPAGAVLIALASAAALVWRRTRVPALWGLVALAPTLFVQAVVPLNILVADRFLLFALPVVAIAVARGARLPRGDVGAAGVVLCLGVLLQAALPAWRSEERLWQRTADSVPDHARARRWLGFVALRAGKYEEAVEHLRMAVASDPDGANARYALAEALRLRAMDVDPTGVESGPLVREAHAAYRQSALLFQLTRAQEPEFYEPLARIHEASLWIVLGRSDQLGRRVELITERPPPEVAEHHAVEWRVAVHTLGKQLEAAGHGELSARVREWAGQGTR